MQKRKEILLKKGKENQIRKPANSTLSINDKVKHNTQTAKNRESSPQGDDISGKYILYAGTRFKQRLENRHYVMTILRK